MQFPTKGQTEKLNTEVFQCSLCDKSLPLKSDLKYHVVKTQLNKEPIEEKSHKCTHCGKVFLYVSHLKRHMTMHKENDKMDTGNMLEQENEKNHMDVDVEDFVKQEEDDGEDNAMISHQLKRHYENNKTVSEDFKVVVKRENQDDENGMNKHAEFKHHNPAENGIENVFVKRGSPDDNEEILGNEIERTQNVKNEAHNDNHVELSEGDNLPRISSVFLYHKLIQPMWCHLPHTLTLHQLSICVLCAENYLKGN